jgi:hypothetical protein
VSAVTVVMSAYNAAAYLAEAVGSILRQTMADFELIIVDDASTDDTLAILAAIGDSRVRVLRNARNLGAATSSNRAVREARSPLIARLDADDVADPRWLEVLLPAFEADRTLALIGAQQRPVYRPGWPQVRLAWPKPLTASAMRWRALYGSPVTHSSAVFRRQCFEAVGGYDERMRRSADYALVSTLLRGRFTVRNVADVLVNVRILRGAAKVAAEARQLGFVREVISANVRHLLDEASAQDGLRRLIALWPDYCMALRSSAAQLPAGGPSLSVFVDAFRSRTATLYPDDGTAHEIDAEAGRLLCSAAWYGIRRRRRDALRLIADCAERRPLLACAFVGRQFADLVVQRLAQSGRH